MFEPRDYFEWRGLGSIPHSGMRLRPEYAAYDAELKFSVPGLRIADPKACQCGEILKGVKKPWECKVFGTACTPETPIGSCMVSSEGACAAYYNFGRLSKIAERSTCQRARNRVRYALAICHRGQLHSTLVHRFTCCQLSYEPTDRSLTFMHVNELKPCH